MSERTITLRDFFAAIDGEYYGSRMEMERGVVDEYNKHITEWPVGYSYKDTIEGALAYGWFRTNPDGSPGVRIDIGKEEAPSN